MEMATLLNNIASTLAKQGKYEDVMEKYNDTLAIKEKLLGINHAYTIHTCNNINLLKREM